MGYQIEVREMRMRVAVMRGEDGRVGKISRYLGGTLVLMYVDRELLGSRVSKGGRRLLEE